MEIIDIKAAKGDLSLETAQLIYMSVPKLYKLIPLDEKKLAEAIVDSNQLVKSETSCGNIICSNGQVVAVQCSYHSTEMQKRQLESMMVLFRNMLKTDMASCQKSLSSFISQMAPIPDGLVGNYLSRLAVHPNYRGMGISDTVLELYLNSSSGPYILHVARDNQRAINFYHRHGFNLNPDSSDICLMIKGG